LFLFSQIINWAHTSGVAPVVFYPLGSKQSAGGDPKNCLRNWQPLLFEGQPETGDTRRTGHYRNGIFYTSRLLVRRRPKPFWQTLFGLVNTTEMCAPVMKSGCKLESHRLYETPPHPPDAHCRRAMLPTRRGVKECSKSCNALEHIWGHMLCQPCHNVDKGNDPRYPWNPAARKHPQPPPRRRWR
jgi:hypothetical protein